MEIKQIDHINENVLIITFHIEDDIPDTGLQKWVSSGNCEIDTMIKDEIKKIMEKKFPEKNWLIEEQACNHIQREITIRIKINPSDNLSYIDLYETN